MGADRLNGIPKVGPRGGPFLAREAEGDDRDRLYALAAERLHKGWYLYEERTDGIRTIPVMCQHRQADRAIRTVSSRSLPGDADAFRKLEEIPATDGGDIPKELARHPI